MSLKLRIKPEQRLFVSGNGWIKNAGNRAIHIVVEGSILVERDTRVNSISEIDGSLGDNCVDTNPR